jgi:hypothetical protein
MFKEICITPQVFEEDNLINDNASWKDVKSLLESIYLSGHIIGINNNDWVKNVRETINEISNQRIKDLFNNLISNLKDRNRIVGQPKGDTSPNIEREWVELAEELNNFYELETILATKNYFNNVISIDDLEVMNISERFGLTGSKHFVKSDEELKKTIVPFIAYAKKVTIIDPYFDITVNRYKKTLLLIVQNLKNKRGIQSGSGSINIHISSKVNIYDRWKKEIQKLEKEFSHTIRICIWDRKIDSIKMHDRYIITDQAGIVSAAGTDKDDYQQSEWSIKDYDTLDEILRQYKENSSPFELKAVITANGMVKK